MGLFNKRTLLLGGLAVAAVAGAMKNRDKVAGLLGARTGAPEPPSPESATYAAPEQTRTPVPDEPAPAPLQSNFDLSGPPTNTATPVAAPEPVIRGEGGIDEAAEERAAAAEAAAIGGSTPEYAGPAPDERADEEWRPLAEAGEGESEGQEETEHLIRDYAEPSAGDPIEGGRQIEDVIDQADDPSAGETPEPAVREDPRAEAEQAAMGTADPLQDPHGPPKARTPGGTPVEIPGSGPGHLPSAPNPGATTSEASAAAENPLVAPDREQSSFFAGGKEGLPEEGLPDVGPAGEGDPPGLPEETELESGPEPESTREMPAEMKSAAVWAPPVDPSPPPGEKPPPPPDVAPEEPAASTAPSPPEAPAEPPAAPAESADAKKDDDDDEWQTWSGRAVEP
jgi:nicotinate-nucleotide--dimethylbenzimidazole phosphoribosyltransferase